ncbi:uncharacterized protein BJ212DRAFT_1304669 [Suillus subaureus]|uniref:Protein MON2 homolog n=1 Tax=Suillus subaureus TaxID=48587 RepID=A0A9P7DUG1_9AGAM|nr:uncharacterized protein BJ212DRAFT_1304669 [Suillus subaureus]KAG1803198.1 hypothetical protein BJ212DRAFT_1304669 [Suillus subaureus]
MVDPQHGDRRNLAASRKATERLRSEALFENYTGFGYCSLTEFQQPKDVMSSLAFLVTELELESLASESRRNHPEIREAAEKSLAILRSSPEQATASLASDSVQSDDLLRPLFMGCASKNMKVAAISLGSLQRLIALKAVPQSAVALIVSTMNDAMSQGVDIQLRILQTLVSLITNFPSIHGELLGEALLLCFKLQDSRIAVVSSTAAATLRQLIMFIFEKMANEDRQDKNGTPELSEAALPDGSTKALGPCAKDAFSVFEDLCLLAISEKLNFLKLEYLHKTFALELIESVLTNYHELFKKATDRHVFPLTLRCTRVVFLILKQFSFELEAETEVFLMLLIRMISEDFDVSNPDHSGSRPVWARVLAMEIMRGVCNDAELIRNIWDRYDVQQQGSKVFSSLIVALKCLVIEKPALLGVSAQMMGVGLSHADDSTTPSGSNYGLDVGGVAGMAATAASATESGVVGIIGSGIGLSVQNSAMKLQCIDQLDKADSPPIPEAYIYLLAVQCIISICEGFASFTGPLYTSIMVQRPRTAGEPVILAPTALDLSTLPQDDPATQHLIIMRSMVANGWPALLAALSFIISTNLSDELFIDVLSSYQALTNVAGMLALSTPRDALFNSLSKFAIPFRVVSSLESYVEPPTPRTSTSSTGNLGLTAPIQAPGLSERNIACLRVLISSALFLAGSLGQSWYGILEALQNADYVLNIKASQASTNRRMNPPMTPSQSVSVTSSAEQEKVARHPLLMDIDSKSLLAAVQRLFDASKTLEDSAFQDFVTALCKLSSEMVRMEPDGNTLMESDDPLSPVPISPHRRRVSGIHLPRTLRQSDFGVERLGSVAMLNLHRLIYCAPEVGWNTTMNHLLWIVNLSSAPQSIRVQAARVLDEILTVVPRHLSFIEDPHAKFERCVLDILFKQIVPPSSDVPVTSTNIELRRMGLETLHQILQASKHTFIVEWGSIFEMLGSICIPAALSRSQSVNSISTLSLQETPRNKSLPLRYVNDRGYTTLVKIAFQCLKLICDSVSVLSPEDLRLCIKTLGQFGRQANTNIALAAVESLFWSVLDSIQAKRKDAEMEPEYGALWMCLLEVLGLCTDSRHEVRVGAIQTLFCAMKLCGATFTLDTWNDCIWKITFPLLDVISIETRRSVFEPGALLNTGLAAQSPKHTWSESKSLALQSIGSIISEFLVIKVMHLDSFSKAWSVLVTHVHDAVSLDRPNLSLPALLCLGKVVKALSGADASLQVKVSEAWECVWKACSDMGSMVLQGGRFQLSPSANTTQLHRAFTQESLVALVDVIQSTHSISLTQTKEWPLQRLTRLMEILKGVLTYPNSTDYYPDVDDLSPLQVVVMNTITDISLTGPGVPSLILRYLSEFSVLSFLAASHVPILSPASSGTPIAALSQKHNTYIALSKKVIPLTVELYMRFKDELEIYEDGTLEAVFSAFSIPIKLKYEYPAPFKFGKDPLWKIATTNFLRINTGISDTRVEGIWRQIVKVFRGGILADCTAAEGFSLEDQEAEESFDLSLINSLEIDIMPHLGDTRVPDHLIVQLAKILHKGSQLYKSSVDPSHPDSPSTDTANVSDDSWDSHDLEKVNLDIGSTIPGVPVPRERFSFWCFDLLFLICSNVTSGNPIHLHVLTELTILPDQESSRKRVAALCLPTLLDRCKTTMASYVADEALRGNMPFPRAREDELLYILRKVLDLRLWSGTLWAALSESPSKFSISQPAVDVTLSPSALIADVAKRSPVAHLFHLYSVLCEIASIPRKTPSAWVIMNSSPPEKERGGNFLQPHIGVLEDGGDVMEVDARILARKALQVLGKDIGAI